MAGALPGRGPAVPHPGLNVPRRAHQVWTADFKGWLRTADGQRHDPLTVRDARSRFLLAFRLLADHEQMHRCHQAEILGQIPPARVHRPSKRRWPQSVPALAYPKSFAVRRVRAQGDIKWQGRLRFIGRAFAGETVGIEPRSPRHASVHLGTLLIGELHAKDPAGIRPSRLLRLPPRPLKL